MAQNDHDDVTAPIVIDGKDPLAVVRWGCSRLPPTTRAHAAVVMLTEALAEDPNAIRVLCDDESPVEAQLLQLAQTILQALPHPT